MDDPIVGLFLLVIDLAINPSAGFPCNIKSFENFVIDVDPGIRFVRLCQAIRDRPVLLSAITEYSREEYMEVAGALTDACRYDHPAAAFERVARWATEAPGVAQIMAEKETFLYEPDNLVMRVLCSHFVSFYTDKLHYPEFFCWTGAWMAGRRVCENSRRLFLRHLSLYTDKADDDGIFPRNFPDKDPTGLVKTLSIFYSNIIFYDLTQQWILNEGAFAYDYAWLSQAHSAEKLTEWARRIFQDAYGADPNDFEILRP